MYHAKSALPWLAYNTMLLFVVRGLTEDLGMSRDYEAHHARQSSSEVQYHVF